MRWERSHLIKPSLSLTRQEVWCGEGDVRRPRTIGDDHPEAEAEAEAEADVELERGALNGLRIVDFSRVLAGPYATMLLADPAPTW